MKKVLVVDRDPTCRLLLRNCLEWLGLYVFESDNGSTAWQLARERLPNLIFSELNMPYMNGWQLLQKLRQDGTTQDIPFIFITGTIDAGSSTRAFYPGAVVCLPKPIRQRDIVQVVALTL